MAYITSEYITVFPTTRRLEKQQDARLLTEKSLVGIINQLVDKDAFIITPKSEVGNDNPFEFNVHGYYFYVTQLSQITGLLPSALNIYATIKLDTGNGYVELMGQDDSMGDPNYAGIYKYKGVDFTDTEPAEATGQYTLKILERATTSDSWTCPEINFYKFSSTSLDFNVDGGIIS